MRTQPIISLFFLLFFSLNLPAQNGCGWFGAANSSHHQVEGMSVVVDDNMYVFYGFVNGSQITNVVERFDPYAGSSGQWTTRAPMPLGVTHTDAVVVGQEIWLIGGFVGNHGGPSTDTVQIYNTVNNTWRAGPTLPEPHASGAAELLGKKIHVIGGIKPDRATVTRHHMVYDLAKPWQGWDSTSAAKPPGSRVHTGSVSMRGRIYIAGGQVGHDGPLVPPDKNELMIYDPYTNSWSYGDTLPQVRSHIETGTFTIDGLMIVTGGNTSPCCPALMKSILAYDPELNQWSELCDMPNYLTNPAAKVIGDKFILAHGGLYGYTNPQNTTYMFNIVRNQRKELGFHPSQVNLIAFSGGVVSDTTLVYTLTGSTPYSLNTQQLPSWISSVQTSNNLAKGTGEEVRFTVDASGLPPGTQYTFNLQASENPSGSSQGYTSADLQINLSVVGSSFPVEMTDFSAKAMSRNAVQLSWATTREENFDYFALERRSASGTSFQEVARIQGKGAGEGASYNHLDSTRLLPAGHLYYRIRMVDLDGTATYSEIASVYLSEGFRQVLVFPNPADESLNIRMESPAAGDCEVALFTLKGEIVLQRTISRWEGGAYQARISTASIPAGCYLLQAKTVSARLTSKVVIR